MTKNHTILRNIAIIISIVLAMSGIIWAFATQSGNLDRTIEDVVEIERDIETIDNRVDVVEKAIIVIQSDLGYIKTNANEQKSLLKEILRETKKH